MIGELILLMVLAMAAGFLIAAIIFSKGDDGTLYFYTDPLDDREYTFAQFNETDIHAIDKKKSITLRCEKLPDDFAPDTSTIMKNS